jgi:DNA-binding IclR family transcriptional regulator
MAYTYEQLKRKTVVELRDVAKDLQHEAVQGYSQMNKEHLLPALCSALGIDMREHHTVQGIDKSGIKAKMRTLKAQRDAALEAHSADDLKRIRRQIHRLNRQIRGHLS